jgi:formamidopyrimidine-DNA glycosylase
MPELPEVETVMNLVKKRLENKKIIKSKVLNAKLRWPINIRKIKDLDDRVIKRVTRRGKYILIEFELEKEILIIHLGMTGIISFINSSEYKRDKHDHLLLFIDDFVFIFNDVRKFGSIHITKSLSDMFLIKNLGIEPLSKKFDGNYLLKLSENRLCTIKEFIMNQKIVVGIGNIYATEALFLSKIHPKMKAKHLTLLKAKLLTSHIKKILTQAIKMGGTTIRDYVNAEGKPGYFTQKLNVYQKKYCPIHKKNLISNIKISGRSSFFCNICQKEKL